ncbi:MAG TPA: hypothetical protein DEB39_04755 [Planctomycetaceae bacterium]|nr:hypothetical protein [Planctomycetaceae bacterium]
MIVATLDFVPGKKVARICGIAQGSSVRAKHVGRDIAAGIKGIFGGELAGYTELLNESRVQAMERMTQHAQKMRADAIINVRFTTSEVMPGTAEMFCYGTAVLLQDE